jgi:hypothetical protein
MSTRTITLGPADRVRLREVSRLLSELVERHDGEKCACPLCTALDRADDIAARGWQVEGVLLAAAR